jgi:hypothetical protein
MAPRKCCDSGRETKFNPFHNCPSEKLVPDVSCGEAPAALQIISFNPQPIPGQVIVINRGVTSDDDENRAFIGQTPGLPSCPGGLNSVLNANKRQMYKRRYPMPGEIAHQIRIFWLSVWF